MGHMRKTLAVLLALTLLFAGVAATTIMAVAETEGLERPLGYSGDTGEPGGGDPGSSHPRINSISTLSNTLYKGEDLYLVIDVQDNAGVGMNELSIALEADDGSFASWDFDANMRDDGKLYQMIYYDDLAKMYLEHNDRASARLVLVQYELQDNDNNRTICAEWFSDEEMNARGELLLPLPSSLQFSLTIYASVRPSEGGNGNGSGGGDGDGDENGGSGNGGGSGGSQTSSSGSGGSGGTTVSDQRRALDVGTRPVSRNDIQTAFDDALQAAGSGDRLQVSLVNKGDLDLSVMRSLVEQAQGAEVTIHADTRSNLSTRVRLYIDPSQATKGIRISGSSDAAEVMRMKLKLQEYFSNPLEVLHLDQAGDFGMTVEVAARIDLTNLDLENLVLYSYDLSTNTYTKISDPSCYEDSQGFLRFRTSLGGDIIFSNGELVRR